ncbi:class I SAM-dependent methyltransferase [Shimwellia pseudoproteus]|uniref:class I SAM-dependent methyltransferase n=1 Tax=Shimwellia pseudoproteus TaxID=570012 RepID=UPI0018EB3A61|nr:class I SAM-dependent methyltransferase [Shimwellia pseudoproteus]MBJ3813673.1 class I SAM-dependent methyltransferase [Shimwellia pseudoproteus]
MKSLTDDERGYLISAEYYDVMSEQHWSARCKDLSDILQTVCGPVATIVDVGSGTGNGLALLNRQFPQAAIHAVEPAAAMRIALMTRVLHDSRLRERVSIYPGTFEQLQEVDNIDLILVSGCIGFFTQAQRGRLWKSAARQLAPGGVILVDTMPLTVPHQVARSRVACTTLGCQRYEVFLQGEAVENSDLMRWEMQFIQYQGERLLRCNTVVRDWHTFGPGRILAEAAQAGLSGLVQADSAIPTVVLRRRESSQPG